MTIRSELLAIQEANNDNMLHCSEVVAWARGNPGSALHSAIEWDDVKAADAHRLWQVRRLIEVHVIAGGNQPAVVSLSIDRSGAGGYRSTAEVAARPDLRQIMLEDALAELDRVQKKYARIEELSKVWAEAGAVRETTRRVRRKAA